jgi:hypothetical protein
VAKARVIAAALSGMTALLAGGGCLLLATEALRDLVLTGALGVTALLFGAAALILGRRPA